MLITKNNIELFSKNKTLLKENSNDLFCVPKKKNKTQMYNQFISKEFEVLFHQ